ncbi:hypothetical protein ACJ6WD_11135 [Streptomyces sp. VTCC 41912]|uniref:hypothetical protein n=1 Tax=Streptomyces TaxID=1883 RepID=UPI00344B0FBB
MPLTRTEHATRCNCGRPIEADEYITQVDSHTICEVCAAPDWDDDYANAFDTY